MFKNLKSLFIIEEETTKVNQPPKPQQKRNDSGNKIVKVTENPVPMETPPAKQTQGQATEQFLNVLLQAMEKNNLEGFDYLEFKRSLQSLSSMPMDEATRYKSALAMATSMGISGQKLIGSADFYLKVLETEEQKFQKALAQQNNVKIHAQAEEVQKLEADVQQKAEQIKRLTEEIDALQQQIQSTKKDIAEATEKVQNTQNNFMASYELVRSQIQQDVENMKLYFGNNEPPQQS